MDAGRSGDEGSGVRAEAARSGTCRKVEILRAVVRGEARVDAGDEGVEGVDIDVDGPAVGEAVNPGVSAFAPGNGTTPGAGDFIVGNNFNVSTGEAVTVVGDDGSGGSGGEVGVDDGGELVVADDEVVDGGETTGGGVIDVVLGTIFTAGRGTGAAGDTLGLTGTLDDTGGSVLRRASKVVITSAIDTDLLRSLTKFIAPLMPFGTSPMTPFTLSPLVLAVRLATSFSES